MRLLRISVIVLTCFFMAFPAAAQTKIGVLDVQLLSQESDAAQDIRKQVEAQREVFLDNLTQKENALREKERMLLANAASLTQEELSAKREEFERDFQLARREAQLEKDRLDRALLTAMARLRKEIFEIVGAIAEEDGYDLILARQNVVLGSESIDISNETLMRLNATISEIPLIMSTE